MKAKHRRRAVSINLLLRSSSVIALTWRPAYDDELVFKFLDPAKTITYLC